MTGSRESKIVTAGTKADLDKQVQQEIVAQGWQADGAVINNPDGTFSQKLVK
jgi:hypothetical protein